MTEYLKYSEEERNMIEKVASRAYNVDVSGNVIGRWIDTCLESKKDIRDLFDGKLRVRMNELDTEGLLDIEEDSEDGIRSSLFDTIHRTVRDCFTGMTFTDVPLTDEWQSNAEIKAIMKKFESSLEGVKIMPTCNPQTAFLGEEIEELYSERDRHRIIRISQNAQYNPATGKVEITAKARFNFLHFLLTYLKELPEENILENRTLSGMKINKYMKTFLPADGQLHERFDTLWSRVVQQLKNSADMSNLVLSIAPIDYPLHSEAMTWGSCHSLDGERSSAGWSFGHDNITAIAYMERNSTMFDKLGIDYPDKSWRLLVHIDVKKGVVVLGLPYPYDNASYHKTIRTGLMRLLADYHGVNRAWWSSRGNMSNMRYGNLPYPDMNHNNGQTRLRLKDINIDTTSRESGAYIGTDDIRCLDCGHFTDNCEVPVCGDCFRGSYVCYHCDERFSEDSMVYFEDVLYCEDCWNELFFHCSDCHEAHTSREVNTVNEGYGEREVCDHCAEYYVMCEGCNERFSDIANVLWNGEHEEPWCDGCMEKVTVKTCPDCDETMVLDHEHEDMTYCDHCSCSRDEIYDNSNSLEINWENKEVG